MSMYMLDTSWATTADERRHLHWELLASDQVRGVFLTACDDTLVVLFSGDRRVLPRGAGTRRAAHSGRRRRGNTPARLFHDAELANDADSSPVSSSSFRTAAYSTFS
jgi:hypothetical protein